MGLNTYYTPTKVTFGKGAQTLVGKELKAQGARRVLVHYGSERVVKSGFLGSLLSLIKAEGIEYALLGGVVPNPRVSLVREGIKIYREQNLDFILAVGGGSVIDSSKAIAYGAPYEGDVWDFYSKKTVATKAAPVGCVLTMAAAGSEMSDSSVITNEEGNLKRGYNSDLCRLRFALENPELTYTLPPYQTAAATVDIMMHTMERYFVSGYTLDFTDKIALSLIKTAKEAGLKALEDPCDYEARANLMWASSVSHNGFTAFGNESRGDFASHQIEHELSGMFDVAHGAGLAAIWPSWARFVSHVNSARFARMGKEVFGVESAEAEATIVAFENFYKSIGMPIRISDMGIKLTDEQIDELAEKCTFGRTRTIGSFMTLGKEEIKAIYSLAR